MELFVTGGTGFVGRALTRQLVQEGHRVRLLIRPDSRVRLPDAAAAPNGNAITPLRVHPSDSEALVSAMKGADAIVHLVGIIAEWGTQTFDQVHVELTRNLVAAASIAGIGRWVHMSALGTRPDARARYHQTKWQAEELVRAGLPSWTIFRPSIIYGAEDEFTHLFSRLSAWSPWVPIIGTGRNLLQPIAVEQVAAAFAKALRRPEAVGQHFDLAGPERLSLETVVRAILHANGRRRWLLRLPVPLARGQARVLEWVWPALMKGPPPLTRDQLLMLQEDNVGDPEAANRLFGLTHESLAQGLQRFFPESRTRRFPDS